MGNKLLIRIAAVFFSIFLLTSALTACGGSPTAGDSADTAVAAGDSAGSGEAPAAAGSADAQTQAQEPTLADIEAAAKQEAKIVSVGMPDDWADWKDTWNDIKTKYGIEHTDTDMSSAEEIAKFEAEKDKPTADIGDIGMMFAPVAVEKGVVQPYKTSYWEEIPDWAKDADGNWIVAYQGTIAFIINKDIVKTPPKSWKDLTNGDYKVSIGDVTKAAQSQNVVLAAAMALGGNETNIQPAIDFFADLAKKGRLSFNDCSVANLEKGEVEVGILWDFNGLSYRDKIGKDNFDVLIPGDGSVVSGYSTIINKYALHPNTAKLAREYILSDAGQINLAKGYARPIRSNVALPDDVKAKMLPAEQYKNAKPITDFAGWQATLGTLPQVWQEKVMINVK